MANYISSPWYPERSIGTAAGAYANYLAQQRAMQARQQYQNQMLTMQYMKMLQDARDREGQNAYYKAQAAKITGEDAAKESLRTSLWAQGMRELGNLPMSPDEAQMGVAANRTMSDLASLSSADRGNLGRDVAQLMATRSPELSAQLGTGRGPTRLSDSFAVMPTGTAIGVPTVKLGPGQVAINPQNQQNVGSSPFFTLPAGGAAFPLNSTQASPTMGVPFAQNLRSSPANLGSLGQLALFFAANQPSASMATNNPVEYREGTNNAALGIKWMRQALEQNAPGQSMQPQGPVQVNSQAEYDALPVGTVYVDSTGKVATKR